MVRPEPCVLFAQSFVHSHLDEYVDEIIFAEPVVITACEFLEQNASSASPLITLVGATSPPSFALEVFVQCEGEPRFRRLCQPFLYSHSSSNVLELEAIVTNHLVVRGRYRSLTLVIYGNTAEDLGQFSVEYDLDSSLVNLVSSPSEGKLEDLPPALHSTKLTFEESLSPLKLLTFPMSEIDLSLELKQFLYLALKICQLAIPENSVHKIVSSVVSVVSSYVTCELSSSDFTWDQHRQDGVVSHKKESHEVLTEAQNELMNIYNLLQDSLGNISDELQGERMVIKLEAESATPELLVDLFNQSFALKRNCPALGLPLLSQNENTILGLSMIFLFCFGGESCFHFVNGGGMGQLAYLFCKENSTAVTLMLLGVIERATRHTVGVEGFLGWWPRQDENVPSGTSECYSHLVKLLLKKQRHDVASLATYLLRRLRFYEIASRYEFAVLSVLGSLSGVARLTHVGLNSFVAASSQLKKLLKLLSLRGPIENPSPVACTTKSLILGQPEGLLSYQATVNLIAVSKCCISFDNIDTNLLSFLKERGFLPLSAALLSSPILRSKTGTIVDIVADIVASIEAILLSFLSCRSGIVFLLHQPEVAIAVVRALKGFEDIDKADCVPLRYATVLISKGFLCRTQEVGIIIELHLRVVNAIDRLITAIPHSEEFLWVLWELCDLSRSDAGRQALLALQHFPEVVLVMIEALCSVKELQPTALNSGTSPLNLALFHAAAEIFEVIVTDSTASSLASWIEHAVELHKALHSSSPGTNRKDAPTRLLEWIDAGVVYHRNGAIGLLKYAAVLASGGDAHLSSANILVSDTIDVENVVGDSSNGSDVQVIENLLGKLVSDKYFEGVALRDSSIAQLTTVFRILAFISENSAVAAALYEESAVTLIYVVVVNCKFMLERSSNTYDYLVDEGLEGNSMSNLLFERSREQSIIDLLIPCLLLLVTLLKKLQEAKDQHRNTKLLNALLRLHREVSPKLAACATDLSSPYPGSALGLGAVCRLVVSALACWPVFGWTPGLFHCLLESVQATSQLALGPKEACSLFCLLGDLFPEEDIWLWKNGMPSLSALRTLGVGTVLGPQREKDVDWYLQSTYVAVLLNRLVPFLDKIAQIVLHFAFTALMVVQDMLRVVIIRIACLKAECACVLLRPMISWMHDHIYTSSPLIDTDVLKVQRLLDFIASLLEYPCTKALLLKEGAGRILIKALESLSDTFSSDRKLFLESRVSNKNNISLLSWCLPVCKSLALLICDLREPPEPSGAYEKFSDSLVAVDFSLIVCHLLKLCKVLPAGRELQACLMALKELASCVQGRSAFVSLLKTQTSSFEDLETGRDEREGNCNLFEEYDWKKAAPFLCCLKNLLRSISTKDGISVCVVEAVKELCLGALCLCEEGKNVEGISVLKFLFGLPHSLDDMDDCSGENLEDIIELLDLLNNSISEDDHVTSSNTKFPLYLVKEYVESMLLLLQKPSASVKMENVILSGDFPSVGEVLVTLKIFPPHLDLLLQSLPLMGRMDDEAGFFFSRTKKPDGPTEGTGNYFSLGSLRDKFLWECPDTSDRVSMAALPVKRKVTSVEGPSRRSRGDNSGVENVGSNAFSRGLGSMGPVASGSNRRDTFRQRKPNTSRPPSMHVDDYVARERNIDVSSGSNVVGSIQRGGSTGGRPPSIHVDEFMARQKERQNPTSLPVGEAVIPQIRKSPAENENVSDKGNQPRPLKADLDDDLQEIDIIFDEELESDDKLPFPQPDENVAPAHVITGENSPRSVVEETESSQFSVGLPPPSDTDTDSRYEFPLRRSISRSEMSLNREPSINSEQNYPPRDLEKPKALYHEPPDETKKQLLPPTTNLPQFSAQIYNKGSTSSPVQGDSRVPIFYPRDTPQLAANAPPVSGSHGYFPLNQPPLPSLPPPPTIAAMPSQTHEPIHTQSSSYGQPPLPSAYPLQAFDVSGSSNALPFSSPFTDSLNHPFPSLVNTESPSISNNSPGASLTSPHLMMDSKYAWASVSSSRLHEDATGSSASTRPPPPLPPTPPPYSAQSSTSQLSQYNQSSVGIQLPLHLDHLGDARLGTSFSMPSFIPPLMLGRPSSVPGTSFTGTPMQQQQTQNLLGLSSLPSPSAPQSIQSMQPRPPLQPPLPPRPPHLPLLLRPLEQAVPLQQSSAHVQLQPLQAPQQIHMPQMHLYYQTQGQQQEALSQPQTHQEDGGPQQQQDSGTTLQQYFSSPEAIQALLSDKEKLCQLLVQYPKLMQMLQERLGQI